MESQSPDNDESKVYIYLAVVSAIVSVCFAENGKWIPCAMALVIAVASITWPRWGR